MNKSMSTAAGFALAVALLAGCGTQTQTGSSAPQTGANRPATTTSAVSPSTPETTTSVEAATHKFGSTSNFTDGLSVAVSAPTAYKPSDSAMGGKEKANVRFEIVIVNKTGKMFDPSMVSISMQSGNSEAEQIYDSAGGLSGSPSTPLLDGREAKFSVGFNVALATDLVMSVHTDFEHEATIFTS